MGILSTIKCQDIVTTTCRKISKTKAKQRFYQTTTGATRPNICETAKILPGFVLGGVCPGEGLTHKRDTKTFLQKPQQCLYFRRQGLRESLDFGATVLDA